ncbi:MAG TPA: eight-cysteine-cluster domain-containing protein [Candidatus Nanoarchaeia archaeon]|nr:eight-cysteine-cluster domain-containing protein [Candidatus Nanoarchaeia archaeon]
MGLKIKKFIPILALFLFLISCKNQTEESQDKPTQAIDIECTLDSDCSAGGCSGQICGVQEKVEGVVTTCEYLPAFDCLKLTSCACIKNKCQWEESNAYRDCLTTLKEV